MPGSLSIQISSPHTSTKQEIPFFESEDWTPEAEKQLLSRIQELLFLIRRFAEQIDIIVNVNVNDVSAAAFAIQKKQHTEIQINNQKLSIREIEILGFIMQGYTNQQIAEKLFISFETVRSHRKNILEKTGAKNTAALINYYHQTFFEK